MNDERGCGLSNKDTRADEGVAHVSITVSAIAAVALWQHKDVNPMVVDKYLPTVDEFVCLKDQDSLQYQNHVRSDTIEKIDTSNPIGRVRSESVSFQHCYFCSPSCSR